MNKAKRLIRSKAKAKAIRCGTYQPRKHKILDEKHLKMLTDAINGRKPKSIGDLLKETVEEVVNERQSSQATA